MSAPTIDSRALVEAAQAGDRDAFGALYERYHDKVFCVVLSRTGNRQLAEDLAAETFTRALRSINRFTWQGTDVSAWLVTIARNLVADYYKSSRYRIEAQTGELGVDRVDDDRRGDPAAVAEVNEMVARLDALVRAAGLTPDQRQVLALRFIAGLSLRDTAAAMGRDVGALKALQHRASTKLCRAAGRVPPQRRPGRRS